MSDAPPGYCFFDVRKITDPDKVAAYRAQVVKNVARHGGRYLVLGGDFSVVEGDWQPRIPVLIAFPSLAQAKAWYESEDYEPLKELRLSGTEGSAVIMEGCDSVNVHG